MEQISNLAIGEVHNNVQSEITEAVMELGVDLSLDMTTEMSFTVFDPDFRMLRNNYFQVRRPVSFQGYDYEIAQIGMDRQGGGLDTVRVTARSLPIQRMRRETGAASWDTISPSLFAKMMADEWGLKMFIQDSGEKVGITRQQGDNIDESTWDVLQRLAADLEYLVFESYGVLYFTSEEFLVERQPGITINLFAEETDPWFPYSLSLSQNDDDWAGSSFTAQVGRENGKQLRPGMTVQFYNCGPFGHSDRPVGTSGVLTTFKEDRKHLISSVTWSEGHPSPVAIQGRTLKETEDTVADTSVGTGLGVWGKRNLKEGMGTLENPAHDVARLQETLGIEKTGIFDTRTTAAVMAWQRINLLGTPIIQAVTELAPEERKFYVGQEEIITYAVDGIINADDWGILLTAPETFKQNLPPSVAHGASVTTTAGALQIDDIQPTAWPDGSAPWYN